MLILVAMGGHGFTFADTLGRLRVGQLIYSSLLMALALAAFAAWWKGARQPELIFMTGLAILSLRWPPSIFAALSVVAGIAIAPALIIQSMLVTRTAQPEHSTEAFTWTTSALLAGVGIGLAGGGVMLEWLPASATFGAGAASALAAAAGARFLLSR